MLEAFTVLLFIVFFAFPFRSDMKSIQNVGVTIKWRKLENELNILKYGRLRKSGEIRCYRVSKDTMDQIGDYVFLFDMIMLLCERSTLLRHRYCLKEAVKITDYYLEPFVQNSDRLEKEFIINLLNVFNIIKRNTLKYIC